MFDYSAFPTLETERLRLREIVPMDTADIFTIRGDYEVTRYNIGAAYEDATEARELIQSMTRLYEEGKEIRWGITLNSGQGDLPKVEAMLKEQPKIVNAVWDWGGGDFESALGGAAHMGRADIARVLLANGARLDLFAAAMLGELEIVRAVLTAFPEAKSTLGPHGIPLLVHAKAGGEKAIKVAEYLESLK